MTMPTFRNPVLGPRIVPFGEPRLKTDVLPNGRPAFSVTDTAAGHMKRTPFHAALDLGNWNGGDDVLAMATGRVRATDYAQGIVDIDHGSGWTTVYAHMRPLNVVPGQNVVAGHLLGRVSNAGTPLIHLHIQIGHNGQWLDPWPLLAQNRGTFTDVPPDHRFYDAIEWAARERLIYGLADGTFRPDAGLTRGQLAVILYRGRNR